MASRSAGTLLTEFKAAYVPPGLMLGHQGHVPGVAFSFGSPYGTTTLKYFQDQRNAAPEESHTPFSKGGHFPTIFSPNPNQVLRNHSHARDRWLHARDRWLHAPSYARFNLDRSRSAALSRFYQMAQQHREYYQDKTGTVPRIPYFVLPVREWDRYPIPTDLPPLSPKKKWHLLRVSPENLRTYQTFPSGKRVSPQERQRRDCYFEFRA
ncbi:protein FAM166C [Hippopotamus amphibius kiboko]|uniref:protein FAM166C n=1 Tax=Hippopotamus amphibius kiboko TaxID=575201 RepID=UPI0025988C94|nr:protein FAM166C [Hippopotamus amphibius kiboko]